ncbi:MAG: hypothetical protein Ct9H300mP17_14400 [Candidatus Nitrosopelagicus sp.]|nr:MAG: hypothetical protein Ct9H300mP17_14400 [Candidatus Nitrosopelagicus sp.]
MKDDTGKCTGVIAKSDGKQIQFNSKVVIDASGFVSVIAKELGMSLNGKNLVQVQSLR